MCAHADYREGFRVCVIELRRQAKRLRRWLVSLSPTPIERATPQRGG
jgi:hypothetical protein